MAVFAVKADGIEATFANYQSKGNKPHVLRHIRDNITLSACETDKVGTA